MTQNEAALGGTSLNVLLGLHDIEQAVLVSHPVTGTEPTPTFGRGVLPAADMGGAVLPYPVVLLDLCPVGRILGHIGVRELGSTLLLVHQGLAPQERRHIFTRLVQRQPHLGDEGTDADGAFTLQGDELPPLRGAPRIPADDVRPSLLRLYEVDIIRAAEAPYLDSGLESCQDLRIIPADDGVPVIVQLGGVLLVRVYEQRIVGDLQLPTDVNEHVWLGLHHNQGAQSPRSQAGCPGVGDLMPDLEEQPLLGLDRGHHALPRLEAGVHDYAEPEPLQPRPLRGPVEKPGQLLIHCILDQEVCEWIYAAGLADPHSAPHQLILPTDPLQDLLQGQVREELLQPGINPGVVLRGVLHELQHLGVAMLVALLIERLHDAHVQGHAYGVPHALGPFLGADLHGPLDLEPVAPDGRGAIRIDTPVVRYQQALRKDSSLGIPGPELDPVTISKGNAHRIPQRVPGVDSASPVATGRDLDQGLQKPLGGALQIGTDQGSAGHKGDLILPYVDHRGTEAVDVASDVDVSREGLLDLLHNFIPYEPLPLDERIARRIGSFPDLAGQIRPTTLLVQPKLVHELDHGELIAVPVDGLDQGPGPDILVEVDPDGFGITRVGVVHPDQDGCMPSTGLRSPPSGQSLGLPNLVPLLLDLGEVRPEHGFGQLINLGLGGRFTLGGQVLIHPALLFGLGADEVLSLGSHVRGQTVDDTEILLDEAGPPLLPLQGLDAPGDLLQLSAFALVGSPGLPLLLGVAVVAQPGQLNPRHLNLGGQLGGGDADVELGGGEPLGLELGPQALDGGEDPVAGLGHGFLLLEHLFLTDARPKIRAATSTWLRSMSGRMAIK